MKNAKTPTDKFAVAKRWTPELAACGFVPVSTFFLENYHRLQPYDLTYREALFVIHLMQHKWNEASPYPAYKTIATRMRVSDKTARRLARSLEAKKYLKRQKRVAQTNLFDLSGLMKALVKLKHFQDASEKPKKRRQY